MKVLSYKKDSYPIAIFINIIPLLGAYKGVLDNLLVLNIDGAFVAYLAISYVLTANIVRLTKSKFIIYITKSGIVHRSMFGWKRIIQVDNPDVQKISLVRNINSHSDTKNSITPQKVILAIKALFNLEHGYSLMYDGRLIATGLKR